MITLLSPAKTLDFDNPSSTQICTQPEFLDFSHDLIIGLSKLEVDQIQSLMSLSPKLAALNHERFQSWSKNHQKNTSKQALLAFKGDVYEGLKAWEFGQSDFKYSQSNLRILSGLYGILRPLDLIQPYRLEMGTVYANPAGKDLYAFWGDKISNALAKDLEKSKSQIILNLASQEYTKAAQLHKTGAKIVSPVFKDEKNGTFKIISFYAKKARGMMANYIITNQIQGEKELQGFKSDGYTYSPDHSTIEEPVFLRSEKSRLVA